MLVSVCCDVYITLHTTQLTYTHTTHILSREDLEEALETTQNPMVWKVRDAGDAMFGESEEAWAVGELLRVDPDFSVYDFAEHMQHYMLPVFLEGFLSGNAAMMECVCEGQAESLWQTNFKERTTKGEVPDTGVLDIDHLDVASTIVTDHTPYLVVTFVTQQVNCTRSVETGDIATGHEGDIRQVFYHMKLKKDFESEHFDWKITEMQFQNMAALAG
jgi:import inner membrane translocase subunit TIM44